MNNGIDPAVLAGYEAGNERGRLREGIGLIEFARTREILAEVLPPSPAVIYDIGGGYGEYSWLLAAQGYRVHLFDLAAANIRMAGELAAEYPGVSLASREVADARHIPRDAASADAILLMGPMYHILERTERLRALAECARLLKPGGLLLTAAITPYATMLWAATVFGERNRLLEEPAFREMIAREIRTGEHRPPVNTAYRGIGPSHFHLPEELAGELEQAGFRDHDVRGVVGCAWLVPHLDEAWQNPATREALLSLVRLTEREKNLLGLSTHLLAVSRVGTH